jgi:hypothetical protein
MLYATAARAEEVLRFDIEDLDRANRRARTIRKGARPTNCSTTFAPAACSASSSAAASPGRCSCPLGSPPTTAP